VPQSYVLGTLLFLVDAITSPQTSLISFICGRCYIKGQSRLRTSQESPGVILCLMFLCTGNSTPYMARHGYSWLALNVDWPQHVLKVFNLCAILYLKKIWISRTSGLNCGVLLLTLQKSEFLLFQPTHVFTLYCMFATKYWLKLFPTNI